jgi:hypothetical protein
LATPLRPKLVAAATVVVVGGLLIAGRWLQPRLDPQPRRAPSTVHSPSTVRAPVTAPTTTFPPLPGITRIASIHGLVDDVAVGRGAVWVATGGLVVRVDLATRRTVVVPGIDAQEPPVVGLTVGAGAVWATTTGSRLLRIDPATARLTASLGVPAERVAADATGVWVPCWDAGAAAELLRRIDPASNRVVATVRLPGAADAVGVGPSGVWVRSPAGLVWRVDPASNRVVATVRLRLDPGTREPGGDVAVARDGVWVSDPATSTVWRIDPRRNRLSDERWEADGKDLAVAGDGVVWATSGIRPLGLDRRGAIGPHRGLDDSNAVITAVAAAPDGLWIGTQDGLLHVGWRALRGG